MISRETLTQFSMAVVATIVINAFIFAGLPLLTRVATRDRSQGFDSPIMIAHIKPPKPPEEIKQRKIRERKLKKMQKKQEKSRAEKPKLDVSQFDFAADMGGGLSGMRVGAAASLRGLEGGLSNLEFELSEVDTPPRATRKAPAMYPFAAKRKGITGKVLIRCLVGIDGVAGKHQILISEPDGVFEDAALKALKRWRFKPGILAGEPVPTWIRVPFAFNLK